MSKLAEKDKFLDLSDYGRAPAVWIANQLKNTWVTPVHVTLAFGFCGLIAVNCILFEQYLLAGLLLLLKSVLDAADGELSRVKNTPSYTGRYLDSIFDFTLNLVTLIAICFVSDVAYRYGLIALFCLLLQGTLYNYYYVILRNQSNGGDKTSRVFEYRFPAAFPGENQKTVNVLFVIYTLMYGLFDRIIYLLDRSAAASPKIPKWLMTWLSIYGLGFQLLLMAILLNVGLVAYIPIALIAMTGFVPLVIIMRKNLL